MFRWQTTPYATLLLIMQESYLAHCRIQIEEKLNWGPSENWATQDFEELSIQMQDKTGQVISATTLKRIWGRVAYDSSPSRHSLDTLSVFLGHKSWRDYTTKIKDVVEKPENISQPASIPTEKKRIPVLALSVFMLLLGASTVIWLGIRFAGSADNEQGEPTPIKFVSRSLANDLPNTVIFEYDVSNIQGDSFFIQQSWDRRRRTRISAQKNVHSSIYFYPGYYSAKLIANDSIIKELPVHVKTSQWSAMILKDMPIYLPDEAMVKDGSLAISEKWVSDEGYDINSVDHVSGFYYVEDFGPLQTENFSMEAVIRHIKPRTTKPCRGAQVTIRGEDGMIRFPFDIPGCAGMMHVVAGNEYHTGEDHDMSPLGADYANWQSISLKVEDKNVRIQIGTNIPYELSYSNEMGKVVGLWFEFSGQGAIDELRLKDGNDRVIYEETF